MTDPARPSSSPPEPPSEADGAPAVLSPGDSDAPDAPEADTLYPDRQGVPGEPGDDSDSTTGPT